MNNNLLTRMQNHPYVRVSETLPGVFACNFTREAFYKSKWDEQTTAARGLFLDKDGNVLARGFEKFFGIGEHLGPAREDFLDNVDYPVILQPKYNGYLVIISSINGELHFFSKSGVTDYSKHAEWYIKEELSQETLSALTTVLELADISLAVEMVDPHNDPHIEYVEGMSAHILNGIKNQEKFELADKKVMDLIGTLILSDPNLYSGVRMLDMWENPATGICRNREDLESALDRVETLDVEGLIAIDANQNMTKVKTQWYKTVKSARTDLNRALKGKSSDRAQKIINALADNGRTLQDFLVDDIRGSKTLNLPIIAELVGIEAFQ